MPDRPGLSAAGLLCARHQNLLEGVSGGHFPGTFLTVFMRRVHLNFKMCTLYTHCQREATVTTAQQGLHPSWDFVLARRGHSRARSSLGLQRPSGAVIEHCDSDPDRHLTGMEAVGIHDLVAKWFNL